MDHAASSACRVLRPADGSRLRGKLAGLSGRAGAAGASASAGAGASGDALHAHRPADALARVVLARPLFVAGRRPAAPSRTQAAAATPLPRLSGIVVAGSYRRAIFELSGKASILSIGDRVDSNRVVAIAADGVTLGDGAHDQTIRPGYDSARPNPASIPGGGLSILDRLNLHQTRPVPLPKPLSVQQFMQRLGRR